MYKLYSLLLIFLISYGVSSENHRGLWDIISDFLYPVNDDAVNEDASLNITELATKYGYNLEEHTVTTQDGYMINLHRLPYGKNKESNGLPVFLMHGILESSDSWVLRGPGKALPYILADHGFDVWMGNARGNRHASKHVNITTGMSEYWHFTWEEIGLHDLPAMIDYVLTTTNKENLYYVGYSQGCTCFYIMCSMRPEFNKKIKAMFSLAPVAWMANVRSPMAQLLSPANDILGYFLQNFNTYSSGVNSYNKLPMYLCHSMPTTCYSVLHAISGASEYIEQSFLPVIMGHVPTGTSTFQFVHFAQLMVSKRFCRYDFGVEKNIEIYGTSLPPDYDLSKVTAPIVLYYSNKDLFSDPIDVRTLKNHLPNVYANIYVSNFSHSDFMYALEAVNSIYDKIIEQIFKFEKGKGLVQKLI